MTHHSSYYIDDSTAPAPLLISNGFTDDLFPPDEAIRFYNRTRHNHPDHSDLAHVLRPRPRARSEQGARRRLPQPAAHNWFDFYVKGAGSEPFHGVQTLTQACGGPSGGATGPFDDPNTDLPFRAARWAQLAPGEVRFSGPAAQTITPEASDQNGQPFDPIGGGGACATAPGADQAGTASYRLDPAPAGGFTLMGSPTIVADINSPGPTSQVAARLLDVDPTSGTRRSLPAASTGRRSTRADGDAPGVPAAPERMEVRGRPHRQARAAPGGPALRPQLERPGAGDGLEPSAAPARVEQPDGSGPDSGSEDRAAWLRAGPNGRPTSPGPQADQLSVALVPAFRQCTSPDSTHVPPLSDASCSSPTLESALLTTSSIGRGSGSVRSRRHGG